MRTHIIILFLIGFLTSCNTNEKNYPKAMMQAEECIIAHPDSALTLLSTLEKDIQNEPEETKMYYNLLTVKAQDKLYIPHTSDSLIKVITDFYENYGDNDKLTEAYYYMGSVYRDMHDAPRALQAFQNAVDCGQSTKQYDILAPAYGQMDILFTYQGLYSEALKANKKAFELYNILKDDAQIAITLRNIARIYAIQEKQDSAVLYYNKAYKYVLQSKNNIIANSLLSELGCIYYDIGRLDTAKIILQNSIKKDFDIDNALLNLGLLYQDEGKIDSAQYYFDQIIKSSDIYKQRHAYLHLSQIENKRKNYSKALEYAYQFIKLKDSIDIITQTEEINKIQNLYNYQHTEKENSELKLANENRKSQNYELILAFIVFSIIVALKFIDIKKKKQKIIEKERKLREFKEKQYEQSLERIEDNKRKINELKAKLYKAEENDCINKQIIQSQKEQLEYINRQVIAIRNEQLLLETSFKQSHIYLLFHKAGKDENIKITDKDWSALQLEIDKTYHNFTNRLYSLYPKLSILELRICYLVKISMQVTDIAHLVNRSKSAISLARTRLYKKIHGIEGTVEMLDKFIVEL